MCVYTSVCGEEQFGTCVTASGQQYNWQKIHNRLTGFSSIFLLTSIIVNCGMAT